MFLQLSCRRLKKGPRGSLGNIISHVIALLRKLSYTGNMRGWCHFRHHDTIWEGVIKIRVEAMKDSLPRFLDELQGQERSNATIRKYRTDIQKFFNWLPLDTVQEEISKEIILAYKAYLVEHYKVTSVNGYLIALNKYLAWLGCDLLRVKLLKQQQRNSLDNAMSRSDYERLLRYAKKLDKVKMFYIMRTLAGTGIRIDELRFITVEAVTQGKGCVQVRSKGKIRDIVIAPDLCRELRQYCKANGIEAGMIFHGRDKNKLLDKAYIWRE